MADKLNDPRGGPPTSDGDFSYEEFSKACDRYAADIVKQEEQRYIDHIVKMTQQKAAAANVMQAGGAVPWAGAMGTVGPPGLPGPMGPIMGTMDRVIMPMKTIEEQLVDKMKSLINSAAQSVNDYDQETLRPVIISDHITAVKETLDAFCEVAGWIQAQQTMIDSAFKDRPVQKRMAQEALWAAYKSLTGNYKETAK